MNKFVMALFCGIFIVPHGLHAQAPKMPPPWDARGVGKLPRQGVTCLDVSDDGKEIAVGTFAAPGDPNVIVLSADGKILRHYQVGQRGINQVAFLPGSQEILAVCTMPAGKAGDRPEVFRLKGDKVVPEKIKQEGTWFFHYGDHSNHPTLLLGRRAGSARDGKSTTAVLAGNQLTWYFKDGTTKSIRIRQQLNEPDATVALAVEEDGLTVVGSTTRDKPLEVNLHVLSPTEKWNRISNHDVDKAPPLEKGLYGTPTLPDGTRNALPQRDEPVWAPLSVAIRRTGKSTYRVAAADYQGWQRWVRSSATMKEQDQGLRFMPAKPTITVYDQTGGIVRRFGPETFDKPFWGDMKFSPNGKWLYVWPHHWKSRGLGGQSILPTDNDARDVYALDIESGRVDRFNSFLWAISDLAVHSGDYKLAFWSEQEKPNGNALGGGLLRYLQDNTKLLKARADGKIVCEGERKALWTIDLNKEVPKTPKPWVANARATPIVPGVWQLPGGRVESDLGGQRLIEAPDGYILIEGHAGLSFEREWAAIEAVGLDPKKVKYVLATHEHGDHAPGAHLWRVATGAKFVCSEEMAYTLQHHIPGNSGYGLHPPVPTDIRIKEDTELDLAGLKVRAIKIPGHTYGSMAWYFEKSGKKFVAFGDLIMPRGVLGYSGSVNFSASDILSSLRKLAALKVDYVLPGHGAVEGSGNYFEAGIDVGTAVGWGFLTPEKPDPRFRITKKNVMVVGWGQHATSAAFGDVNGDGKPDVVMVAPDGDGSVVKFFLNHGGKFSDKPDHEIKVPVSQPHKIRVFDKGGLQILVAGKTAVLLSSVDSPVDRGMPRLMQTPLNFADGNHVRILDGKMLVSRRFGGFYTAEASPKKYVPEIDGPYVDFRMIGGDLLTSYGKLYRRGTDGKFPKEATMQLPIEKDWNFLAVGDFNGDGKPDAALLSYGMDKTTAARVFYNTGKAERPFADKADAVISLSGLLAQTKKGQSASLVRDTPVVADWNGDGIDDLIVAHGQSDEVLVLLGGKDGLSKERVRNIPLEYRVHYEHGVYVGDFNGDGKADLAVFGYTNTGVGSTGPPAVYVWLQ